MLILSRLLCVFQLLISGGKRGSVCIFDVRRRQVRHRFAAHEAAIKCMALDPAEEYFVTGSDEGDIKVSGGIPWEGKGRNGAMNHWKVMTQDNVMARLKQSQIFTVKIWLQYGFLLS